MSCHCRDQCREVRKRAKHTHVAGANCCSSFKNVFSDRHRCRCRHCRGREDEIGDEVFVDL